MVIWCSSFLADRYHSLSFFDTTNESTPSSLTVDLSVVHSLSVPLSIPVRFIVAATGES